MLAPDRFRFLNLEGVFHSAADWNRDGSQKLWLYNLHYFDDLSAEGATSRREWHASLLSRWILENPLGHGNGWEPYPTSLRIVNWIKWALSGTQLPPVAAQSLAVQVRFLHRRLEFHLLGNHLFANAKALIFAGLFFLGDEADIWLGKGLRILVVELPEQVLKDGGHFERSPLYHGLIEEDLLDLINLHRTFGRDPPADWLAAGDQMHVWLNALTHPDGQIALFNDSAFALSPTWAELNAYRLRLGLATVHSEPRRLTHLRESGYIRCELGAAVLLLDVAPIGPDYIPGHAHADTLTFELSLFGRRVIVDSGTSTYEKDDERNRQRGTLAHNTLTLNRADSSEVWGGFRVARRARPFALEAKDEGQVIRVTCSHDGYCHFPGRPVHRREWQLGKGRLLVRDFVSGSFAEATVRFHFHPAVQVTLSAGRTGEALVEDAQLVRFQVVSGRPRLISTTYHPGFNMAIKNQCLEIELEGSEAEILFQWAD